MALPLMKIADLAGDMRLLNLAQEAAKQLLEEDPELSAPEDPACAGAGAAALCRYP